MNYTKTMNNFDLLKEGKNFISIFYMYIRHLKDIYKTFMVLTILIMALEKLQNREKNQIFVNNTKPMNNFELLKEGKNFISIFYIYT